MCQAELLFHPSGRCANTTALPALQQYIIQMHKNHNLSCRETAMEDVAGIALPVDINQCFNHKTVYLFGAFFILLGSSVITQSQCG